ncbi:MAG: tRNA dihydrouridine synthase DusB [Deltaproteobacteria bacterium]|nr:tRNA dihydrouridine synthase DusB [Deltaproteobacteria bacterium]
MPATGDEGFRRLFARPLVVLAPMEDVTDAVFRALCRRLGADLCFTEFVNVEGLLRGCRRARRKMTLGPEDQPTAIQIYGADAGRLCEAAEAAAQAGAAFVDINCGCSVAKIARRGAGSGWLRDPRALAAMAALVVRAVSVPVTVKTRVGMGTEPEMPIVDLARRLEDAGVRALSLHCRTVQAGLSGRADWSWAARAQAAVRMPVIVNGDIRSAEDARRALAETGCAGVMVGRRAIEHPWIFREARALLERGEIVPAPSVAERLALCREHLAANHAARGEPWGVRVTRRHLAGYLRGLPGAARLRQRLFACDALDGCLAILAEASLRLGSPGP